MAADNAELVRNGFASLKERGVAGLLDLIDPEFEMTTRSDLASEPDTYRGHAGLERYFESFYDAMDDIYFEGSEFIAVGDKVLVPFTLHATGRSSGIEVEQSAHMVWTLRNGKAVSLELFADADEAMAAAHS